MPSKQPLSFAIAISLLALSSSYAQTRPNTEWLKTQLNTLVSDSDEDVKAVFDFDDCQMTMNVDTKEEGIAVKMNMNWPLKEITKVSFKPAKKGKYTLLLDIPSNKVKGRMKVGRFSRSLQSQGDGSHSSFDLNTKDEKLMQQIQHQLESSIQACQNAN